MFSRSYHNAIHEIRVNGITTADAISKHGLYMTDRETEIIKAMEVRTMRKATKRINKNYTKTTEALVVSVTVPTGCKIRTLKKSPKASNCKVFRLVKDDSVWTFTIKDNTEVEITSPTGATMNPTIEDARSIWSRLTSKGFSRQTETVKASDSKASETKVSKKTDSKPKAANTKKATAKGKTKKQTKKTTGNKGKKTPSKTTKDNKKKTTTEDRKVFVLVRDGERYTFTECGSKMRIAGYIGASTIHSTTTKANARKLYKALTLQGFKAA